MIFTYGATNITITTAGYPLKTNWQQKQNRIIMEDGSVDVYDREKFELFYTFKIKLNVDTHAALRDFIRNTLRFRYNYFTVTPDSHIDLGLGNGVAIYARYWSSDLFEDMNAYSDYEYEITIRYD